MSRHISILFNQVKRNGVVFVFAAKFKEKFAKFLVEADFDRVGAFGGAGVAPSGGVAKDIVAHLFAVGFGGLPVDAPLGGVEDLVGKGLGGGGFEPDDVVLGGDVV